ncbi:MAG: Spo0B domain-containing protein [Firmicutes bacterium]|nr:Spo0B domain-containing protein [Bacillota bacterium]
MDSYMSVFFMLTVSFPEALVVSYFVITFMGGRVRLPEIIIIALIQAVIAYTVRSLPIPMGAHTILQLISYVLLISLISRLPILASSVGIIVISIIYLLTEIAVTQLVEFATGLTMAGLVEDQYNRLLFFIPTIATMFTIAFLFNRFNVTFVRLTGRQTVIEKYKINSEHESSVLYRDYLPAVVFVFLPLFLLWLINFTNVSVKVYYGGDYPGHFKVLFNVLVIILAFMSLWAVQRVRKSMEKEIEAARAAETINSLKELILSIRKQRHDFNHQLQAVYGLMEAGSFGEAREYIKNTYHYVAGTGELIKTDNPAVSALIYTKIGIAETRNIKFDIYIECSLEEFPLNANQSSSFLGNLIDNAFDAVEVNGAGERLVRLGMTAERGEYIIEVTNRGELDPEVSASIFSPNFTTKAGHSGLGLAIVKEIADKHRGSIQVSSENGETVFRADIPFKR